MTADGTTTPSPHNTTAPRPPRRRLPAEERRTQLIDASIRLLARDGFARTTADAITAEAGVSKGLLWRHFDDLTDLLHQSGLQAPVPESGCSRTRPSTPRPVPTNSRRCCSAA